MRLLSSMTGYGKQMIERDTYRLTVEMRSVNNRFLDITLKMPRTFFHLEEKIKKIISSYFTRGKMEVYISVSGEGNTKKNLHVDWDLLSQYFNQVEEAKNRFPVHGEIITDQLLRLEDIFVTQEEENDNESLKADLLEAVEVCCRSLQDMRKTEGSFLKADLLKRLEYMEQIAESLQKIRPAVIESYRERIKKRMEEHLSEYVSMDDNRILQEVAILAEKGDITEELTRLASHILQMNKTLKASGSVGRKLDFICQEMHREANTIGSKATAAEVNELVVELKTEIEKMKEQVQNIE